MFTQLKIALGDLLLIYVIEVYLLPQYEQPLLSPFPPRLLVISSCVAFTSGRTRAANSQGFPFQNGSDDLHAAHAPEVAQYIAELYIHLGQDFLHTLNHAARLGHQVGPLPPKTTRHPDFVRRLKTVIQQPKSVQLQQPLTLLNVALASWHILRMLRIHQIYFQALLFENLEYRHPIHAGGL